MAANDGHIFVAKTEAGFQHSSKLQLTWLAEDCITRKTTIIDVKVSNILQPANKQMSWIGASIYWGHKVGAQLYETLTHIGWPPLLDMEPVEEVALTCPRRYATGIATALYS